MITREFQREVVETGITLYRAQAGCASVAKIVGQLVANLELNQDEIDVIREDIEFWVGKILIKVV